MNESRTISGEAKGERRRVRNHRSEGMKKFARLTRDKKKLLTAFIYLLLSIVFVMAGFTFLFTPGSFSGD